jgi:hypothetical protein
MTDSEPIRISAVLIEEEGRWAAQFLEFDIAAQAPTLAALQYELHRVLLAHLCISMDLDREPFAHIPPAPQKYWDMFRRSTTKIEMDAMPFRVSSASAPRIVPQLRVAEAA